MAVNEACTIIRQAPATGPELRHRVQPEPERRHDERKEKPLDLDARDSRRHIDTGHFSTEKHIGSRWGRSSLIVTEQRGLDIGDGEILD